MELRTPKQDKLSETQRTRSGPKRHICNDGKQKRKVQKQKVVMFKTAKWES